MKKFFYLAAMSAFALVACDSTGTKLDGSGDGEGETAQPIYSLVLNELSGEQKYIELYNNTDAEISLEGYTLVKYDSKKDGGKSTTWTGAAEMKIASKAYVVLESSDLSDPAEGGVEDYAYESEAHVFKGGLSGKKNVKIELYDASGVLVDTFQRGEEGAGWNQVKGYLEDPDHSFSRCPDGTTLWGRADHTKGASNAAKVGAVTQQPEM